jgi:hypothetical protein
MVGIPRVFYFREAQLSEVMHDHQIGRFSILKKLAGLP